MKKQVHLLRHDDDEWYDGVRIVCVPRYKTSEMSGDEWRVSYRVELLRKGEVLLERSFTRLNWAVMYLGSMICDESPAGSGSNPHDFDSYCCQTGCKEPYVSEYEIIQRFSKHECVPYPPNRNEFSMSRRRFCRKHLRRGDCGLEDADRNYRVVEGPGPGDAAGFEDDVSESVYGGNA